MQEIRLNIITREWVVIQCDRARRPESFRLRLERKYRPQHEPSCPFCTGNESKTPKELLRVPADGPWRIRVTPNKFSVLSAEGEPSRENDGLKHTVAGVGKHEVIIESPQHDMSPVFAPTGEFVEVLGVYRQRFVAAFSDERVEHVIIFKNHGPSSGTTIEHPHSQLIGMPITPIGVRNRIDEAMRYFDNTGGCLTCVMLGDELRDGRRIVLETEHFVAFIPYAALSAFHTWIVPRRHMASFADCDDAELGDLAGILREMLGKLHEGLDDPDYNYMIFSQGPFRHHSEYVHWYLSLVPRLMQTTGSEMGSGIYINPTKPEEVAGFLRGVKFPLD